MDANAGGHGKGQMEGVDQGMMRAFSDADGDGLVIEAEVLAKVEDWFTMMDRSGDGVITTDDFGPRG